MTPLLTVAIPIRNRSGKRLENNLVSLLYQTLQNINTHLVVIDYGSDATNQRSIQQIAPKYGASIITINTNRLWNKSHALNFALRQARTPYFMSTDVDMIYRPNFLQSILKYITTPKTVVSCQCKYLLDHYSEALKYPFNWDECDKSISAMSKSGAVGACFATDTKWLESVGGWDEFYEGWGKEDQDIVERAKLAGYNQVWITGETDFYHQYHDDVPIKQDKEKMQANADYYYVYTQRDRLIKRNGEHWGSI